MILQLLEITPALGALEGVAMELEDCAFPLLRGHRADRRRRTWRSTASTSRCSSAAVPRKKGMERAELLEANGGDLHARRARRCPTAPADDVQILVVGNPANTNCLIAMNNAPNDPDPSGSPR